MATSTSLTSHRSNYIEGRMNYVLDGNVNALQRSAASKPAILNIPKRIITYP